MSRKIFYFLMVIFLGSSLQIHAQAIEENITPTAGNESAEHGKNLIKLNLLAIPLKNASLQYERAVGRKTTVALGVRFMPESSLPFKGTLKKLAEEESSEDGEFHKQVDNIRLGNLSFTPEFRFYTGQQAFRGFYLAPFARYANFQLDFPFELDTEDENNNPVTETIPLKGNLSTVAGGLMIGAQWKLSRLLYLDWWILGPQYGVATGSLRARKSLTTREQADLKEQLDELADDISIIKISSEINDTGAKVVVDGPWAGIRAGLCIGVRF